MPYRSSYLMVGDFPPGVMNDLPDGERLAVANWGEAVVHLANPAVEAIVLEPKLLSVNLQAVEILENLDQGIAVLGLSGVVTMANPYFRGFCQSDPIGKYYLEALGAQHIAIDDSDVLQRVQNGIPTHFRLSRLASLNKPYLKLSLKRVCNADGKPIYLIAFAQNVSDEVEQQRKLDALHKAGQELSRLDAVQIAEMNIPTRVELLKNNLRHYIHDLLHYDIIEVRVLVPETGELRPLLEEGMTPEAAKRVLYAGTTGNGVTGYVAATGHSYVCNDASKDALYLQGATGARSSMTVALKYLDEVVGTLNVESPRLAGFGVDDLQFTELFSKEIALALHTLNLLSEQQKCTVNQSLDLVNREMALPMDDILAAAAQLLQHGNCQGDDCQQQLARIIQNARTIKDNIQKVGREILASDPRQQTREQPLLGKRVLVIDSDERTRRTAHQMFERLGAGIETSTTASDGIAMLQQFPFDAVLMEVRPPDLGGFDTYTRLKAARPNTPVSMTTGFGYDSGHAIVKARAAGMRFVLFKPFIEEQLIKAVVEAGSTATCLTNGTPK